MKSARVKLILMFLLFASPFLLAWIAYFVWPPTGSGNRGELLKPPVLLGEVVVSSDDKSTPWKSHPQAGGKWILLQADNAVCDAACQKKLHTMRQAHAALGKYQDRVRRAFLVEAGAQPDAALKANAADWIWLDSPAVRKQLPAATDARDYIYLVDPLGNLFMRYRKDVEIRDIHKDLMRVLKASQIG
jgi:hypothetical protein